MNGALRALLLAQAAWYIASGLVSLLSRDLFEAVTGPKEDYWLVRMVGLLAVVIGAAIGWAHGGDAAPLSFSPSRPEARLRSQRWTLRTG